MTMSPFRSSCCNCCHSAPRITLAIRSSSMTPSKKGPTLSGAVEVARASTPDIGAFESIGPILSNIVPAANARLAATSTTATLEVNTNVDATCRFGYRPGIDWGSLTEYDVTGGQAHSHSLSVVAGGIYLICTRCEANGTYSNDSCVPWSVAPVSKADFLSP